MKKWIALFSICACIFCLAGCNKNDADILHLGLNAEIIEIDALNQVIYVTDSSKTEVFGGKCGIDCSVFIERENIIYVDYDTGEVSIIQFSDLAVGDAVIINAYESQMNCVQNGLIEVEQIQLGTQRLSNL